MYAKILNFGKYKGKSIDEIMLFDRAYIGWAIEKEIIQVDENVKQKALNALHDERMESEAFFAMHDDWGDRD